MLRKLMNSVLCGALLAGGGAAMATQPEVLSDAALDSVSAGSAHLPGFPGGVPTSYAVAYAFSSATAAPGVNVIIDVGFSASGGIGHMSLSSFNNAVTTIYP